MSLNGDGPGGQIKWAVVISIVVALAQFVGYGIWIGGMSKQIDINTEWIRTRGALNVDSRIAVAEERMKSLDLRIEQLSRHLDFVDTALQSHIREDRREAPRP